MNSSGVTTNFDIGIIEEARNALAAEDMSDIALMTDILHQYNRSGLLGDLGQAGLAECTAQSKKDLKKLSRDATGQTTCPAFNDICETAETIDSFPFRGRADLTQYSNDFEDPTCAVGGNDAIWKITPAVGTSGRTFVVSTSGSTFDTLVSVWSGTTCEGLDLNLVACNDNTGTGSTSQVVFTTDGTSTYYIVAEGTSGAVGRLRLRVTSF